jgi:ribosomal protein S18 acetylase RimI-like enzyme
MMIVDTDAENAPAISFFRHHGFVNEDQHVYLSKNLTSHPGYQRLRRRKE